MRYAHHTITRAQREALRDVYRRGSDRRGPRTLRGYRRFRYTAQFDPFLGCLMVPWAGMVLGI